jgi:hypothetical protein
MGPVPKEDRRRATPTAFPMQGSAAGLLARTLSGGPPDAQKKFCMVRHVQLDMPADVHMMFDTTSVRRADF